MYYYNNKQEKLFAIFYMSTATSLKHQQPSLMAVETGKKEDQQVNIIKRKKWNINIGILATWISVIVLTVIFWYFIFKLFI
jgi:hypothetical protein